MFTILKQDTQTRARTGEFALKRGTIKTPAFFPVATAGAVKGLSTFELEDAGTQGLLANAYHLFLRPGVEVVKLCGGLHKFMNWDKPILTDSGGYQIFSQADLRKVTDQGVDFQSHIDGARFFLTPEDVMRVQLELGADIVVPLDECCGFPIHEGAAAQAVKRTLLWAGRSKAYFQQNRPDERFLFGIIQGSVYPEQRLACLQGIQELDFDGLAIGGLSVGEPRDLRYNMLSLITENADPRYLRYFMGYGLPQDILEAVSLGVDLFDCVIPTRYARSGTVFTRAGKIVVRNSPYISDTGPLDQTCGCRVCRNYSRAYLRHLINAGEMLAAILLSHHNVFWYNALMVDIRKAIAEDRFAAFKKEFLGKYNTTDD